MGIYDNNDNMLSVLESFTLINSEDIAKEMAGSFRKRRVEKNISRRRIAEESGVPLSTVTRFEQKGLISLDSLIKLAMALGYVSEVKNVFGQPKFSTLEELAVIRRKTKSKRAYPKNTVR